MEIKHLSWLFIYLFVGHAAAEMPGHGIDIPDSRLPSENFIMYGLAGTQSVNELRAYKRQSLGASGWNAVQESETSYFQDLELADGKQKKPLFCGTFLGCESYRHGRNGVECMVNGAPKYINTGLIKDADHTMISFTKLAPNMKVDVCSLAKLKGGSFTLGNLKVTSSTSGICSLNGYSWDKGCTQIYVSETKVECLRYRSLVKPVAPSLYQREQIHQLAQSIYHKNEISLAKLISADDCGQLPNSIAVDDFHDLENARLPDPRTQMAGYEGPAETRH